MTRSKNVFYFSQIVIYFLKLHLTPWNLDCVIPKGISHTSLQNPTYEFQKRNISSIQENNSSIQNFQGLSFLPVTFTGLVDLFTQLRSWHGQLCGDTIHQLWWSIGNILASDAGGLSSNPGCDVYYFFMITSLEPRFKSGFHNSFWDYVVSDRLSWMTLEIYKWNLRMSFG